MFALEFTTIGFWLHLHYSHLTNLKVDTTVEIRSVTHLNYSISGVTNTTAITGEKTPFPASL